MFQERADWGQWTRAMYGVPQMPHGWGDEGFQQVKVRLDLSSGKIPVRCMESAERWLWEGWRRCLEP